MAVRFLNVLNLTGLRPVFTTLAHSLWLGVVMALFAGIIIILTNRSASILRYKLLTGLLVLFTAGMAYIFYDALTSNTKTFSAGNIAAGTAGTGIQQVQDIQPQKDLFNTLLFFIETNANTIVFIWFIVICFKCTRLISGLRALNRLKKTSMPEAGTWWIERMNELAARIGITKQVTLLQSSLTKIPMVIGHLKPVILFPIGILNALPANEVEAILLHELAHIRRNDFLINLLQQFAEIFFFFNPGVLWVSSLIKNERENCCDDIAIAVTHDKNIFIHALVSFQEYSAGLSYATTFPGSKNHLLNRVKRIITNNNKTLNNMEKLILASGIIITSLVAMAFSAGHPNNKKEVAKTARTIVVATNADVDDVIIKETKVKSSTGVVIPKDNYNNRALTQKEISRDTSKIHYSGVIDGKKIQLTEEDGQVKELYVDGKKIPEDQYDKYAIIIDKIHRDIEMNTAKLRIESSLLKEEKEKMEQQETVQMKEAELKKQNELINQGFLKQDEQMKKAQAEMQKEVQLVRQKNEGMAKIQSLKMQEDLMKQQKQLQQKQAELQKQLEKMKLQQEKFNEMMMDSVRAKTTLGVKPSVYLRPIISVKPVAVAKAEVSTRPVVSVRSVTSVRTATSPVPVISGNTVSVQGIEPVAITIPPVAVNIPGHVTSTSISNEIINDLEKANIITTRNNLSFRITNKELIVNGVKQPDAVHKKILKKYIRKPGDNISLDYSNRQ